MEWKQVNEHRWVSDCGCRAVYNEDGGWWIVRNSHGYRISETRFTTLEEAKSCVEAYVTVRRDAGLYPYGGDHRS